MRNKRILYLQYTNPAAYPPLQHSSRILADARWDVLFLGTRALGSDGLEFPQHKRIRVLRMPFCAAGMRQKLHYLRYVLWSFWWTLRWRPRWIYASDPLSAPAAWLAAFLPSVRVVYHEHDALPDTLPTSFMRLVRTFRRRIAEKAAIVLLPNAERAAVFARDTGIPPSKPICVWNCPARDDGAQNSFATEIDENWLYYHGNISPQLVPLSLIDVLAMLPPQVKLRVIGYETAGSPGHLRALKDKAASMGIDDRIEVHGAMNRDRLLTWARKSHIGIALMPMGNVDLNMRCMAGASNKPFDYLASGVPLLVSNLPDWDAMFVRNGVALSCNPDDPESIAAAVRWYLTHPAERREMGEAGRRRIQSEWNYENQFAPVRARLEAAFSE